MWWSFSRDGLCRHAIIVDNFEIDLHVSGFKGSKMRVENYEAVGKLICLLLFLHYQDTKTPPQELNYIFLRKITYKYEL